MLMMLAGLGALVYLFVAIKVDATELQTALTRMGLLGCALVLLLSMGNYLIRFARWQYYIARLGHRLPLWRHMPVYLSGFALTVSPGKGGEAVRAIYMRDHGVTYSESIAALFSERLLDALAMTLLAGLAVSVARQHVPLLLAVLGVIFALLALLGRDFTHLRLTSMAARHTGRLALALRSMANVLRSSHRLLQGGPVLIGLSLALSAWGAEGFGFHLILQGLHLHVDTASAIGIYAIGALAGAAAFFLPGGIGGTEVVMTTMLVHRGAPLAAAVIATLLCRLATLWFAVVVGIISTFIVEAWPDSAPPAAVV
jgi:glycosyltransferase 2 family protein